MLGERVELDDVRAGAVVSGAELTAIAPEVAHSVSIPSPDPRGVLPKLLKLARE
jgi:hypothetical protein